MDVETRDLTEEEARGRSDLDRIGIAEGTDKASIRMFKGVPEPGHDYLRHYEAAIAGMSDPPRAILDLGVGPVRSEFASARMWKRFFPEARVVAVDIRTPKGPVPAGVDFIRGDMGRVEFLTDLARQMTPDLVIEDASHMWAHQLLSLVYLLPVVTPGGVYIWEDLQVAGPALSEKYGQGLGSTAVDFLGDLSREILVHRHPKAGQERVFDGDREALPQVLAAALAALIDSISIVGESAIITRRDAQDLPRTAAT
jgi:hypothetical protein